MAALKEEVLSAGAGAVPQIPREVPGFGEIANA